MPAVKEIEAIVSGRVTGVLFRDFVRRRARRLGLVGTVENQPDQTVRVVAQGGESSLRPLISYLERGSLWSKVEKVEVIWREPTGEFGGFRIIY
ncbi:MAG: acylphosphatase [Candidatus Vogelbacteria bacterium]|nr:acylphosphatase [Candidatus Vogelbacteria bacterium]